MMYILDTDVLSLLERGGPASVSLQMRLDAVPPGEIATTIVTFEEQMQGWLSMAARAQTDANLIESYGGLHAHMETFSGIPVVQFDSEAEVDLDRLYKAGIRIGTMDRRIAAMALANDATLLSRNLSNFSKVPGLTVEDWTT